MGGTNCKHHPAPNNVNECSINPVPSNNTIQGRNFCSMAGSGGNGHRIAFCNSVGTNEWLHSGDGDNCSYNNCDHVTNYGGGCCNGCCGIVGRAVECKRYAFQGDPLTCCFNDYVCSKADYGNIHAPSCFEKPDLQSTCAPEYRSMAFPACKALVSDFCAPSDDTTTAWQERWYSIGVPVKGATGTVTHHNQPCLASIYRNIYSRIDNPTNPQNYTSGGNTYAIPSGRENEIACMAEYQDAANLDTQGFKWAQETINSAIKKYVAQGGRLDGQEGDVGVNPQFNETILSLCTQYPGLCTESLRNYCANVTVDQLKNHVGTLNWCGSYMPDEQYAKYTNLYQINKECTPMSNRPGVIPLADITGTVAKRCEQNLCLLDDVAISLTNSQIGGTGEGISFSQVCGGSGKGGADSKVSCIISDLNIEAVSSSIKSLNLSQNCGSTVCYASTTDSSGKTVQTVVDCDAKGAQVYKGGPVISNAAALKSGRIYLLFILVLMILIIIFYFIFSPSGAAERETIIPRERGMEPITMENNRYVIR